MSFPSDTLPGVLNLEYRTPAEQIRRRNEAARARREEEDDRERCAMLGVVLLIVGAVLLKPWLEDKRYL